jgi:serine protease AprX
LCGVGEAMVANQIRMTRENGTSFATPLLAGFAACAWQLNPRLTKDEIYKHLLKSGSLYPYFDYAHGYGIPKADYFFKLKKKDSVAEVQPTILFADKNDTIFIYAKEKPVSKLMSSPEFIPQRSSSKGVFYNGRLMKKEGKFAKKADEEELDGKNYVYYHIADEKNKLMKYAVLKLESENIFYVTKKNYKPGYTLRVFYSGYLLEYKF